MAEETPAEEAVELKFRLFDGSDIGPMSFGPASTVQSIKESIISHWPPDKTQAPKSVNEMKLINGGKVLDNNRTLAESRVPIGEVPGGIITMHVVLRLSTGEHSCGTPPPPAPSPSLQPRCHRNGTHGADGRPDRCSWD